MLHVQITPTEVKMMLYTQPGSLLSFIHKKKEKEFQYINISKMFGNKNFT